MLNRARFILTRDVVKEKLDELKQISDRVSYSYKTNREVGDVLQEMDCDFSVHSIAGCDMIKDKSRVWYFAQGWSEDEIKELLEKGVTKFVVDNINDLQVLKSAMPNEISLLLRMRLKEHTVHTGKHYVYGFSSEQINEELPKLHVKELGIHFHRKTQNVSEWSIAGELDDSIKCWDCIDLVNIGGGLPVKYRNSHPPIDSIISKIKELKTWLNKKGIKMIIEPGRYIAAPAVILEANIVSMYNNNIIIDCSVFNSAMDTFVANVRLEVEGEKESGTPYTIKGCTPDSMDIFRYRVFLDKPESKIRFLNAGAYTYTTDFCNLPKLETEIITLDSKISDGLSSVENNCNQLS